MFLRNYRTAILFLCCLFFVLIGNVVLFSQVEDIELNPSFSDSFSYEISEIVFEGNNAFNPEILIQVIGSRPTETSLIRSTYEFYYGNLLQNPSSPLFLKNEFKKQIEKYSEDLNFYSALQAEHDVTSLWNFYNKNGFHESVINFRFDGSNIDHSNTLTFIINEGRRAKMIPIVYLGLDDIPPNIASIIQDAKLITDTIFHNEALILSEIDMIQTVLQNNGYFYSKLKETPVVVRDTKAQIDSITVTFIPGIRQRIEEVGFIDSLYDQHIVTGNTKSKQLVIRSGDWYSKSKVEKSQDNLLLLGTFDRVTPQYNKVNDSTILLDFFSQYRRQQEFTPGIILNQDLGNYRDFNLGVELEYTHRNIFGAAQLFNIYINGQLTDIIQLLDTSIFNYEYQAGFQYAQPHLWQIGNSRVGFTSSPGFSYKEINGITLETFSFPFKFQIKQPDWTYFQTIDIDLIFDRQRPINFGPTIDRLQSNADTYRDSANISTALQLYGQLDDYMNNSTKNRYITSNVLGVSLISDKRDNYFSPNTGSYSNVLLNASFMGLAENYKIQFTHFQYWKIGHKTVLAAKIKSGYIWFPDLNKKYIPLERQFFAGGANSVRGWSTRKLRYTKVPVDSLGGIDAFRLSEDIIGNNALLEGSIEFRFTFDKPKNTTGTFASLLESLGVTVFFDFGNAFGWFAENDYTDYDIGDFFTKLAAATGFGVRYQTPIGPIRIDFGWPIYDPLEKEDISLSNFEWHFGIGHAF